VFWNILKNAVKFTQSGGNIWVRSHVNREKTEIAIEVADTGIGMDEAEIGRIFEAFAQGEHAKQGHRFGGLGLGLAITRTLVSMHGGHIEAHSPGKDRGSSFWVYLPLIDRQPHPGLRPAESANPPVVAKDPSAYPVRRGKILLIEDHEPTRNTLKNLLRRRGFDVVTAASFESALARAAEGSFDLVLSDIGLPDGDGFMLMRRLRDEYQLKGIALTGYGMEEDVARSGDSGFLTHFTKPISVDVLDQVLEKIFPTK
jgi:CheY-like chemotaxis protein